MLVEKEADGRDVAKFRINCEDLILLAMAVAEPGDTVVEFVEVLRLAMKNNMQAAIVLAKMKARRDKEEEA